MKAMVIFGASINDNMTDELMVTVIATGSDGKVGSILNPNKESLDDLMRKFPNCYKNMQEFGFLIEDDFDELASIRLRNKIKCFASKKFQLMVFPTQDCNLKCWYCYETHQQNTKMTPEVMERIYLYVKNLIENNSFDSLQRDRKSVV